MSGPFWFILTNHTLNDSIRNCSQVSCYLNSCWADDTVAVIVYVPGLVSMPVNITHNDQLVLSRLHQDFEITALVMITIVTSVASAAAAKIVISQSAAVASTADSLARQVAIALETQNSLNVYKGILQLNLQTALLQ